MKRCFAITAVVLCSLMFVGTGCKKDKPAEEGTPEPEVVEFADEPTGEDVEKGKFEMIGDVPPAPGDEEPAQKIEAPAQKIEEPAQKTEEPDQKQVQKF